MNKSVLILTGAKGSGKTYIGTLIQEKLNVEFFRVEEVWLRIKEERISDEYIRKGFSLVEEEIDKKMVNTDNLIIESTAAHEYFNTFLKSIRKKYNINLIKVVASPEVCAERIKSRDQIRHIPVSDDIIEEINIKSFAVDLPFNLVIDNNNTADNKIVEIFRLFFNL